MGASQSSGKDADGSEQVGKTSYYDLLGLQRAASEQEIKKAYRKKALELHPDRNYGNEESATRIFAEVQAAYEVLSDSQERAWYDSHESAILRGDDAGAQGDDTPAYQNIQVTSADDLARLVRKFNSSVQFSDAPSGFFGFLRDTFAQLAKEEEVAASWDNVAAPDYPSFGHKDDKYDEVVKTFYSAWSSFGTAKSFAWRDKYKLSDAPDRWYRRRMEQENKAFRKEGIREFNDAVRAFVAFVRKRDPRYVPSTQSEAERQQVLRDAAASQAARARAANQAKLAEEVPEWSKIHDDEEGEEESEEEEIVEEILECVACDKTFKSEGQFEAHEKSKKHQKALHALQKKMRKQNADLDLESRQATSVIVVSEARDDSGQCGTGNTTSEGEDHHPDSNGRPESVNTSNVLSDHEESDADDVHTVGVVDVPEAEDQSATADLDVSATSEDDDYASPEITRARLQSTSLHTSSAAISEEEDASVPQTSQPKMGKAAQKRAKKAAAAATLEESMNTHRCAGCDATFPSRTRLFQHIKDHGHEAPRYATAGGGGKSKKPKGKR